MGQHDAGAADADALGLHSNGGDQDFRRGADDGRVVVMLRHPKPVIAKAVAMARHGGGVADGGGLWPAGGGDGLVEHRDAHGRVPWLTDRQV